MAEDISHIYSEPVSEGMFHGPIQIPSPDSIPEERLQFYGGANGDGRLYTLQTLRYLLSDPELMGTSLELHKTPVYQRNFKRLSDEIRAHQASKEHPSDRPVSNEEGLRRAAELKRAFRDYYARPADTFDDDKVFPLE